MPEAVMVGDSGDVAEKDQQIEMETEVEEVIAYSMPILKLVKQQQLEHGLRHRDYSQYRRYCTNRARRLRKFLNFKQGERRKVTPRKVS